jgi:DNA-directed RNA polymerase specialized sigma24 family protein
MSRDRELEEAVERARQGNRDALESVVEQVQDQVYGIALRMLWHPEDARDATQEILVRVVTRLAIFRGESGFRELTGPVPSQEERR